MPSLRDIKKRIRSVNGSQKITKAMKLVAASKLKRAQDAVDRARPYAEHITALLARVARSAEAEARARGEQAAHPLFASRPTKRSVLVVVSSDRGSCGAFNSNVIRHAERFLNQNGPSLGQLEVWTVGRKARDYFAKRKNTRHKDIPDVFRELSFGRTQQLAQLLIGQFLSGELDAAYVVYNEAISAMAQVIRLRDVLPAVPPQPEASAGADSADEDDVEMLYAPNRDALLDALAPAWVAVQLHRALLESVAAEHGARMTAMEAATKNAQELVETLTLQYNRLRQAAITTELMDIIGGAEALAS